MEHDREHVKVMAQFAPWRRQFELAFAIEQPASGQVRVARPLIFEETDPADGFEPTIRLTEAEAQDLINELWRTGLRPTHGISDEKGALSATERHLEDMRRLVFADRVEIREATGR